MISKTRFQQNPSAVPDKRAELQALHQKVQQSKAQTEPARSQKNAFAKLSFMLELLYFYENQNTEPPEVIFAQRMPGIVEQLVITGPQDNLDEKLVLQAENLLAFVINPDHRLTTINNIGKGGGSARTLKFVLRLRADKVPDLEELMPEFVKHLIVPQKAPTVETLAAVLRLIHPNHQKPIIRAIMSSDRLRN